MCMFCKIVDCPFDLLRFTVSDYPFGIFKLLSQDITTELNNTDMQFNNTNFTNKETKKLEVALMFLGRMDSSCLLNHNFRILLCLKVTLHWQLNE